MYFQVIPEAVFQPSQGRSHCYGRRPCYREMPVNRTNFLQPFLAAAEMKEDALCRRFLDVLRQTQEKGRPQSCCNANSCQKTRTPNKTVLAKLDFHEFSPEEIKVKITDRNILVHGRHQDESSFFEVRRSVPLPKNASKPDVVCRYVDGHVILDLPQTPQIGNECRREKAAKSPEKAEKAEDGKKESDGSAKKECELSEEEKKNHELFMKNLRYIQSLFLGIPFSEDNDNRDTEEKKEVVKDEEKDEKTKADEKKTEADKTEVALEEAALEAETQEPQAEEPEADGKDEAVTDEKPENTQTEADEQTCLFLKYDDPDSEPSDDFVQVNTETRDASETEEHTDETSTEVNGQVDVRATDRPKFKAELDISKFKPDDIRVVFTDGHVIVSGEREIEGDNYTEVEKWSRRIKLPEGVDESKLNSVVDTDGIMTIEAPYHPAQGNKTPREIQIELED